MSKEYMDAMSSLGLGIDSSTRVKKGFNIERFQDDNLEILQIDGLYDDDEIDKEALKEELGKELKEQMNSQIKEILKGNSQQKEQEIKEMLESLLKEKEQEKQLKQLEFNNALEELESIDIIGLEKEYEKKSKGSKQQVLKETRDDIISEYKTDTGTTVIVNTGNVGNKKVSKLRYNIMRVSRGLTTFGMVLIVLSLLYLFMNPEKAAEVGVLIDTKMVPFLKVQVLPMLGETLNKTVGEGIDRIITFAKGV